ncbi:MAG: TraR/DksA C4-type zinc finger protein [bacterium]|nr:TraR/DksA C4-type zinc finger protein [bacterium]
MDQNEYENYRNILLRLREQMVELIKNDRPKESLRELSGENPHSFHLADQGSGCNEHEKAYLLASIEGDALEELDDALRRIQQGNFGTCLLCGADIGFKRLEAIPYAKLCINCKAKEESELR